jgi:hypothetical protein
MQVEIIRKTVNEPLQAIEKQHGDKSTEVVRTAHILSASAPTARQAKLTEDCKVIPSDKLAELTTPAALLARILVLENNI